MGYLRSSFAGALENGKIKAIWKPLLSVMRVHEFVADATITEGQAVMLDFTELDTAIASVAAVDSAAKVAALIPLLKKVIPTGTAAAGEPCFVGHALHGASAGEVVYVANGFVPKILLGTGDVADGAGLVAAGAAGASETYAAGTHTAAGPYGFALSTEADNGGFVAGFVRPQIS